MQAVEAEAEAEVAAAAFARAAESLAGGELRSTAFRHLAAWTAGFGTKIGEGGFGAVYEAVVPRVGLVAVKRVSQDLLLAGWRGQGRARARASRVTRWRATWWRRCGARSRCCAPSGTPT